MHLIPLGISAAVPTRDRHLSAAALVREGEVVLFDCGEGTQFRFLEAGLRPTRISTILISHLHGDHVFGLPGLLSTLAMMHRTDPLTLVGPAGLERMLDLAFHAAEGAAAYPIDFVPLEPGFEHAVVVETPDSYVEARPLDHTVFTVGYRFQEKARPGKLDADEALRLGATPRRHFRALKAGEPVVLDDGSVVRPEQVVGPPQPGRAFAYCFDTRPTPNGILLARDADLLYHEATYADELRERAGETGHATAGEAAAVAAEAGARRLLIGHFSSRYTEADVLVEEARAVFPATEAAVELASYPLERSPSL